MGTDIHPSESHLKARILNELRRTKRISQTTIIANELPLSSTGLRADMALCSRYFTGIEIKSNLDSLKRLPKQLSIYKNYFDKTILVIGNKHWEEVSKKRLSWLEIWVADGLKLKRIQKGTQKDRSKNQIKLLPAALREKYRKMNSPSETARSFFISAFRQRFYTTNQQFWKATRNRKIYADDLLLLSRFVDQREQSEAIMLQAKRLREEWLNALAQSVQSSSVSKNNSSSP